MVKELPLCKVLVLLFIVKLKLVNNKGMFQILKKNIAKEKNYFVLQLKFSKFYYEIWAIADKFTI
ncbi:MAG: hypothetical protein BroJett005_16270 [Ignavibacteriota bacterium]|nr:MAG: hypothetical protein BroJett005_16270 [Ignavibacteriota bacterium]